MTPETPFTSVETPSGDQHAFINNAEGWGVAFIRRLLIAALERAQEALTPPNNSEEADALKVIQCTFDNIKENL